MNKEIEKKISDFQNEITEKLNDNADYPSCDLELYFLPAEEYITNQEEAAAIFSKILEEKITDKDIITGIPVSRYNTSAPWDNTDEAFFYQLKNGDWVYIYPYGEDICFLDKRLFEISNTQHVIHPYHARNAAFRYILIVLAVIIFTIVIAVLRN